MDSRREVARAPSAWRRVITAAIGLALIGLGASVIAYIATSQSDDPQADLGYLVGGYLVFVALPFAVATAVPFGRFRRVLVAIGSGLLGLTALSFLGPFALVGAAVGLYLGFRIAR